MKGFTRDWFRRPREVFEKHLAHLKGTRGLRFLEIGSFEGMSAVYFFDQFLSEDGHLVCIDPYQPYKDVTEAKIPEMQGLINHGTLGRFLDNTDPWKARLTLMRSTSRLALPLLRDGEYDVVYVDGDHSKSAVLFDGVEALRLAKTGGYIVFDDYEWQMDRPAERRPKEGIDLFLQQHGDRLEIIHKGYVLAVQKK